VASSCVTKEQRGWSGRAPLEHTGRNAGMEIERIVDIAAPPEKVWTVLTDIERWPEWTTSVTSVELLSEAPLNIGSQARIRQPRLPMVVWTVTAFETGRYFEWQNIRPGL